MSRVVCFLNGLVLALVFTVAGFAAEPSGAGGGKEPAPAKPAADEAAERDDTFRKLVTNVKLLGHFTMDGQPQEDAKLRREEYVITGATKLGNGDVWLLTSRITYGDVDLTVPVPVEVKWAGNTPVITLDNVGIPGLGTFSARVVLDQGRYAGTWSHDKVGGHMFGRIVPAGEVTGQKEASPGGPSPRRSPPAP